MRFSARLTLLPVALLATVAHGKEWIVAVGRGGLKFDPEVIPDAKGGDTVTYQFYARNHSVVASSFGEPCKPLAKDLIFSAFVPNESPDVPSTTSFTITIKDKKPLWFYCAQGNHCQQGMVHSINAPPAGPGNSHDEFKKKAKDVVATLSPPGGPPGGLPVGGERIVKVQVGGSNGSFTFTPNDLIEPKGTVVQFSFNPANHSVVQSSFEKPCSPLEGGGFSSGFIPTQARPSGALFHIKVTDEKPIWFYCGQGRHCQTGMVGSVNAPAQGNTLAAFADKAKSAGASSIPPKAPQGGTLAVNGTNVASFGGSNVLNFQPADKGIIDKVPKPGENMTGIVYDMAGGRQPINYGFAPQISDDAVELLRLVLFLDNVVLTVLWTGFDRLKAGGWAGVYPKSIVSTIGSMSAQALVHRQTATDSLQNYRRAVPEACKVRPAADADDNVEQWLQNVQQLMTVQIGVMTDVMTSVATTDPWLVPALASQVGAKARMSGMVNMMQNHKAAASPREALIPARLGYAYVKNRFVDGDCAGALPAGGKVLGSDGKVLPPLVFTDKHRLGGSAGDQVNAVTVRIPAEAGQDQQLYMAWIGAWGGLEFTTVLRSNGFAPVPDGMYGNLYGVLTTKSGVKLQEVASVAIAGPEPLWVSDPNGWGN
ncbi:hypothetical protein RB598_009751 [Gaeumannomyces tritici]